MGGPPRAEANRPLRKDEVLDLVWGLIPKPPRSNPPALRLALRPALSPAAPPGLAPGRAGAAPGGRHV